MCGRSSKFVFFCPQIAYLSLTKARDPEKRKNYIVQEIALTCLYLTKVYFVGMVHGHIY